MSIGKRIKQLRELRNFTQAYMANELGMTAAGYGKIERDATDLSIKRLQRIADILNTDYQTILNFDDKNIFNMYNNHSANAIVQNQQYNFDHDIKNELKRISTELEVLRAKYESIKN
jgi:transcriptional regulator with XRE-family HTH domain